MKNPFSALKNRFYYAAESIKNRYPCKIINVHNEIILHKKIIISYQAATKLNVRQISLEDLLDDPLLIEKFHPTDCVKLGFLSAAEILIKKQKTLEESFTKYQQISKKMFSDLKDCKSDTK